MRSSTCILGTSLDTICSNFFMGIDCKIASSHSFTLKSKWPHAQFFIFRTSWDACCSYFFNVIDIFMTYVRWVWPHEHGNPYKKCKSFTSLSALFHFFTDQRFILKWCSTVWLRSGGTLNRKVFLLKICPKNLGLAEIIGSWSPGIQL
mmetsp:Transcript_49072/g.88732  ORF Transcript_49072/g.88732 Transcript_49072/m.88732 type:complete len:148 (-) Transcript_49072:92-535(-)